MFLSRVGTSDSFLEEVRQDQQKHISSITIATVALDSVYLKSLHLCSSKKMEEIFTIAGAIAGAKSVAHVAAMTLSHLSCWRNDAKLEDENSQSPCDSKVIFQWMVGWWFFVVSGFCTFKTKTLITWLTCLLFDKKLTNRKTLSNKWPWIDIHELIEMYSIPGTCLSSVLGVEPSKRRPFSSKTRVILGSRYTIPSQKLPLVAKKWWDWKLILCLAVSFREGISATPQKRHSIES